MTKTKIRWYWEPETYREWLLENGLILPRTPQCVPWCVQHCQLDPSGTFCMGPDIRTPHTPNGYVGITYGPETSDEKSEPRIDLGDGLDVVTVEQAEELAQAILTQVARARGQEVPA